MIILLFTTFVTLLSPAYYSGTLAQSVQSACFTRKRSLVRIQYVPHRQGAKYCLERKWITSAKSSLRDRVAWHKHSHSQTGYKGSIFLSQNL